MGKKNANERNLKTSIGKQLHFEMRAEKCPIISDKCWKGADNDVLYQENAQWVSGIIDCFCGLPNFVPKS